MTVNFVPVALKVCEDLYIFDKRGQGMVMRFAKLYTPEKMGLIRDTAKQFSWWEKNSIAAFMKSVGEVNRKEKNSEQTQA